MHYKLRTKSSELIKLDILYKRMDLSSDEKRRYTSLKKGFEGEVLFDLLTEKLKCDCLILNDLLLSHHHTDFQLDTIIIGQDKIHLYEVKNNEGDYYFEADNLYNMSGTRLSHPIHQINRSESLLQQVIYNLGYKYSIESSVIYINPSFTMYNAPLNQPIIYPTQIKAHLTLLNNSLSILPKKHYSLADELIARHQPDSRFEQTPHFKYNELKKGITCLKCHSFLTTSNSGTFICPGCQHTEKVTDAILRSISEFRILFPNEKITTSIIYDWCKLVSSQRIRRILLKHFNQKSGHRWAYYV